MSILPKKIKDQYLSLITDDSLKIARVIRMNKRYYTLYTDDMEYLARIKGTVRYKSSLQSELPVIGDYVLMRSSNDNAFIEKVLDRQNVLYRKSNGKKTDIQILASNIDYAFILVAIDNEMSVAAIGRYVSMAYSSNIKPVLAVSKIDLYKSGVYKDLMNDIKSSYPNEDIFAYSAKTGKYTKNFLKYIIEGSSSVFIGSSGSGKSTIINYLLKEEKMKTNDVREYDYKGMHTTTHRELFELDNGGVVIDTPGLRALGVWEDSAGIEKTFSDLEDMAKNCKFNNCTHQHEPGCYILEMVENDKIPIERYSTYITLKNESKDVSKSNILSIDKNRKEAIKKMIKSKKNN